MNLERRKEYMERAKIVEKAELFSEMKSVMYNFVKELGKGEQLTEEERNLLSVAYKNVVGARRTSWRSMLGIESKLGEATEKPFLRATEEIKETIERELKSLCGEIIELLDNYLISDNKPSTLAEAEPAVFFYKMKGDYYRYLVETAKKEDIDEKSMLSFEAYNSAQQIALELLPTTHPIRLGLALNFSVYFYEIANDPSRACELAKDAFDRAIEKLGEVKDELYKDSTLIMQLLRDNLTLWQAEDDNGEQQTKN